MEYRYFKHIVLALARRNEELLLVEHKGREDTLSNWWLPGGQAEQGEELVAALQRELLEETGLHLEGPPMLAFVVQVLRETEEGLQESLAFHFSCTVSGQIYSQDPDDLVLSTHWIEEKEALHRLQALSWYDCEPLRRWLDEEAEPGTVYTQHTSKLVIT